MAASSQPSRNPAVVAQQPRATQSVSTTHDGGLTITYTDGEDPMQALQTHFGTSAAQPPVAAASASGQQPSPPTDDAVTLSFRDDRAPVTTGIAQDQTRASHHPSAGSTPAVTQAQPSPAPDGSIRIVFQEGQDPMQALMEALMGGGAQREPTITDPEDEEDDEVAELLTHFGQGGTAADRSSDRDRALTTLQRHASRMSTAPQPPHAPVRQSTLPRRQPGRSTTAPTASRRTGSRWSSVVASPDDAPSGEDAGTTFHALSDDGTALEVITLADGRMELRLQGHDASEQAEQQLASMVVEDRTATQGATPDGRTATSGTGPGLRRLESIVGGEEDASPLGCKCAHGKRRGWGGRGSNTGMGMGKPCLITVCTWSMDGFTMAVTMAVQSCETVSAAASCIYALVL